MWNGKGHNSLSIRGEQKVLKIFNFIFLIPAKKSEAMRKYIFFNYVSKIFLVKACFPSNFWLLHLTLLFIFQPKTLKIHYNLH